MLTLPSGVRLFLATQPTDLRRSYDGLGAIVEGTFGRSARSGDVPVPGIVITRTAHRDRPRAGWRSERSDAGLRLATR